MRVRQFFKAVLLGMAFFVTACGKLHQYEWPATVSAMEDVNDSQRSTLVDDIAKMNESAEETLVNSAGEVPENHLSIVIRKVPNWTEFPKRAGYSTLSNDGCVVELAEKLFTASYSQYRRAVVWHELGHCAGLQHVDGKDEVMSPVTDPFFTYTKEAFTRFFSALESNVSL